MPLLFNRYRSELIYRVDDLLFDMMKFDLCQLADAISKGSNMLWKGDLCFDLYYGNYDHFGCSYKCRNELKNVFLTKRYPVSLILDRYMYTQGLVILFIIFLFFLFILFFNFLFFYFLYFFIFLYLLCSLFS